MKQRLSTVSRDDKLPEDYGTKVKLRIHPDTQDLNVTWAKDILGLSEDDPAISRVFVYRDEGVVGCDFRNGEELVNLEDVQRWQRPVFRLATEWLKVKS